jgi:hypothetical protein
MPQQQPRSPGAKEEASENEGPPLEGKPLMTRFEALTRRLLTVPPEEVREAERAFAGRKI